MKNLYYLEYSFVDGFNHIKRYNGENYYYKKNKKRYADMDICGELCSILLYEGYLNAMLGFVRHNIWLVWFRTRGLIRRICRKVNWKDVAVLSAIMFAVLFMVFSMFGCSTAREYRNSSNIQHDTIRITNTELRVDSVWRDRVQLIEIKGDSVYIRDSVVVERWRLQNVIDTFWYNSYQTITDSVYIETPTIKRERSKYDIFTSYGFWIELGLLFILFIVAVIRVIIKMKKLI